MRSILSNQNIKKKFTKFAFICKFARIGPFNGVTIKQLLDTDDQQNKD